MGAVRHVAGSASTLPRLISIDEAAALLAVSDTTVRNWIKAEAIPYLELPPTGKRRRYRIPLQGLLNTLTGTYDLGADLEALSAVFDERKAGNAGAVEEALERETESRARPRGGTPTEVEGSPRDLFAHARGIAKP